MRTIVLTAALGLWAAGGWTATPTYTKADEQKCLDQALGDGLTATWDTATCPISPSSLTEKGGCCHGYDKSRQWTTNLTFDECYAIVGPNTWHPDQSSRPASCQGNPERWGDCCYGPADNRQHRANLTWTECDTLGVGNSSIWTANNSGTPGNCVKTPRGGCCYGTAPDQTWKLGYTEDECTNTLSGVWTEGTNVSKPSTCQVASNPNTDPKKMCCYGSVGNRRHTSLTEAECNAKPGIDKTWGGNATCAESPTGGCCHGTKQWTKNVSQAVCYSKLGSTDWRMDETIRPDNCGGTEPSGHCWYTQGGKRQLLVNVTAKTCARYTGTFIPGPPGTYAPTGGCCYNYPSIYETKWIGPIKRAMCEHDYGGRFTPDAKDENDSNCPVTAVTGGCCYGSNVDGYHWSTQWSKPHCEAISGGTFHPNTTARPNACPYRIVGGCCYGRSGSTGTWATGKVKTECAALALTKGTAMQTFYVFVKGTTPTKPAQCP